MPRYCSVYGCFNNSEKNRDVSYHDFPSNNEQAKAWKIRIRREGFEPSKYSYVCSKHFRPEDFTTPSKDTPLAFQKPRLKRRTVPSVLLRGETVDGKKSRTTNTAGRALEPLSLKSKVEKEEKPAAANFYTPMDFTFDSQDELDKINQELEALRKELKATYAKVEDLEGKVFRFDNLSDVEVKDYTNLTKPAFLSLNALIDRFRPLRYWTGSEVVRIRNEDQLLICLLKLKLDTPLFDIAKRYGVSRTTVHNIFLTYLHALNEILYKGMMNKIPSLTKNQGSLPDTFGDFSNCRLIIDCTEFRITTPRQDLNAATASYSNYKHNLTSKFLIGVAPNGSITFVSAGFPGSTSDKVVTEQSGVLSHLKVGLLPTHLICKKFQTLLWPKSFKQGPY